MQQSKGFCSFWVFVLLFILVDKSMGFGVLLFGVRFQLFEQLDLGFVLVFGNIGYQCLYFFFFVFVYNYQILLVQFQIFSIKDGAGGFCWSKGKFCVWGLVLRIEGVQRERKEVLGVWFSIKDSGKFMVEEGCVGFSIKDRGYLGGFGFQY